MISIDEELVQALVAAQFPQWAALPVRAVEPPGWDNRSFRLGEHLVVRLPSAAEHVPQVDREQRWLPVLAPLLPLEVPMPLAKGEPAHGYPWSWSVYRWIPGDAAAPERISDLEAFAQRLAEFLIALQSIDATGAPRSGSDNFHRGGALATYDGETRRAIAMLEGRIDTGAATAAWEQRWPLTGNVHRCGCTAT